MTEINLEKPEEAKKKSPVGTPKNRSGKSLLNFPHFTRERARTRLKISTGQSRLSLTSPAVEIPTLKRTISKPTTETPQRSARSKTVKFYKITPNLDNFVVRRLTDKKIKAELLLPRKP